jgi:signal peptidase I
MKQFLLPLFEVLEMLAIVLVSIYIVYGFVAQPFLVQGASMEPNFSDGDYLLIDEITYRFREPDRGEVIVFRNPNNQSEFYIKRIVGLPGDQIAVSEGNLYINGAISEEEYLPDDIEVGGEQVVDLNNDQFYVMGDNRPKSYDSRSWGALDEDLVVGLVRFRFWPLSVFGVLTF